MNTALPTHFVDSRDFARIARAIAYIDAHFREQPRLEDVAVHAGLSEFHFNRLFRRWAGVTPKQYLVAVTGAAARDALAGGHASVLDAALEVGLSGPGRLHDLVVTLDAMTPGELKAQGEGLTVRVGFSETPFGRALFGETDRGLFYLGFVEPGEEGAALEALKKQAPRARFERDDEMARTLAVRIWAAPSQDSSERGASNPTARGSAASPKSKALRLNIGGTNFQLKVWQALIDLGSRDRTTYSKLAAAVGSAGGSRAVGGAVGANPIAWLIPCHHVLRQGGALGGYHWGEDRKRAILAWETASSLRSPMQKRGPAAA